MLEEHEGEHYTGMDALAYPFDVQYANIYVLAVKQKEGRMSHASVAQINARLPRELKESGDAGLRELGVSPSDAIRALWKRLSGGGKSLEETETFLFGAQPASGDLSAAFDQSELSRGWDMVAAAMAELGIRGRSSVSAQAREDNDLVAEALEERMRERGLM